MERYQREYAIDRFSALVDKNWVEAVYLRPDVLTTKVKPKWWKLGNATYSHDRQERDIYDKFVYEIVRLRSLGMKDLYTDLCMLGDADYGELVSVRDKLHKELSEFTESCLEDWRAHVSTR